MRHLLSLYYSHLLVALPILVRSEELEPVSVSFNTQFLGYDGPWSAVSVRAGTPQQWLSLFPNTVSAETWLAGENYCTSTDQTCITLRGGVFHNGSSSTWQSIGQYEMGYSELLQQTPTAQYGFDVLALSDFLSAPGQIIALTDDINHWVGSFGLNVQNTRFSSSGNSLPFLSTLVQNLSIIPSHSYGYSAGAAYHSGGVSGSLTLGGVDSSRYEDGKTWFTLSAGYTPTVSLQSIKVAIPSPNQQPGNNLSQLMTQDQAATFVIDSSTPYLWLPESVCDDFARALNLTWNSTISLYTFGSTTNLEDLLNLNLTFTFTLAGVTGSASIDLSLSFSAFNLQLSYPFPNLFNQYTDERVNYFPLRRTNNPEQYTIGRCFLQETYLIVDYERNVFSLNQAVFPTSSTQTPQLAIITRPKDSTWPGPANSSSKGLTTGARVGIAIGIVALALVLVGTFVCVRTRQRRRSDNSFHDDKTGLFSIFSKRSTVKSRGNDLAAELNADKYHPTELVSDTTNLKFELSAATPHEMPGAEVSPAFFQERVNAIIPQRNDPRSPVELTQPYPRNSMSKDDFEQDLEEQSTVPPYSPVELNQRYSSSLSPNFNTHRGNNFLGRDGRVISPFIGSDSDRGDHDTTQRSEARSNSTRDLSPISPITARDDQKSPTGGNISGGSGLYSVHNKVSPQSTLLPDAVHAPSSRDGRLKEDPVFSGNGLRSPEGQGMQQPHASAGPNRGGEQRFSWE